MTNASDNDREPHEAHEAALRTIAMPKDTNPNGDIFGGWLLSQMDLAGSVVARERAGGRCVTVAVNAMSFHRPVFVGDEVSCYSEVTGVGRTSMTVHVTAYRRNPESGPREQVTEGTFTFVRIDDAGRPKVIEKSE
ncbi:MAG: acyl-CoA thioesterase [Planctomycetota bacterium]|nr:MAG: acyl-CoA thioesterase [Planctomycetota bacterium]REJ94039.1 MAG: acyl-CoA thioesterase [Planctomycetota bacterium]REK17862.1 MAG: acyl-CoA thioesterase [Planctomycetota bacterium]REK42403.1 MAG: acyl-CoA thioesterase [Planctomycetota bacterium]